jgi:transcriptional regulator with XRE-family HTH domain
MFRSLLKEEIDRRNIGVRKAAEQIGVSHCTIYAVFNGRPLEVKTAYAICKWMGVPLSTAVDEPQSVEAVSTAFEVLLRKVPELKNVFTEAVEELNNGCITPDDFRDIVDYAAYKIRKRKDSTGANKNHEAVDGGDQ